MLRRKVCQIGMAFLLGAGWFVYDSPWWCTAFVVYMGGLYAGLRPHLLCTVQRRKRFLCVALAFLCGSVVGEIAVQRQKEQHSFLQKDREVQFQGEIYKKESKAEQPVYYLQDVILQDQKEQIKCSSIILYPDSDDDIIGTIYIGKAKITPFRQARNDGNFDEKIYYESNGIVARLEDAVIHKKIPSRRYVRIKLYELQQNIAGVYGQYLFGEESGVLQTLALGEKGELDTDARALYQMAGLSHILAISGLHISVVGMAIYRLLRKRGVSFGTSGILAGVLVMLYGMMTGMSPSTKRAIVMYSFYLLANIWGEVYDSANALMIAAVGLVATNPLSMKNTGVIFSFAAVLGVISFANPLVSCLKRGKKRWLDAFVFALGLQLFTLPLVARFYYEIPIYSVFLNWLLLPLLGILLGCGLLGGLLGVLVMGMQAMCGSAGGYAFGWLRWGMTFVTEKMMLVCHGILYLYEWVADITLQLPGARQVVGCPALWKVAIYYGFLYMGRYWLQKEKEKRQVQRRVECYRGKQLLLVLCGLSCLFWPTKAKNQMIMLDVGQGDGIYLQSAKGASFFVDGGSSDVKNVGTYRILPFLKSHGVRQVDYWFVSHPDMDHMNGLLECLQEGYHIKNIVLSKELYENMQDEEAIAHIKELEQAAQVCGSQICFMQVGDVCHSGDLQLQCVGPSVATAKEYANDVNAMSLCLIVTCRDFSALLTGDIAAEQETELLPEIKERVQKVDVLKVAHHGSNASSGQEFLTEIEFDYAFISCGKNNMYGHPGKETMERLQKCTPKEKIYVTMDVGQITMELDQRRRVKTKFER